MSNELMTHVDLLLPDYVTGRLSRREVDSVEWHLRACERCRSLEAHLRTGLGALRIPPASVPESYFTNLVPRIQERRASGQRSAPAGLSFISRLVLPLGLSLLILISLMTTSGIGNGDLQMMQELRPIFTELTPDEVTDVLNNLDSIPLTSGSPLVAGAAIVPRLQEAGMPSLGMLRDALAENDALVGDPSWSDGLPDVDSDALVASLEERML